MKLGIVIRRIGPYHAARLEALAASGRAQVLAIEMFARERTYDWEPVDTPTGVARRTLFRNDSDAAGTGLAGRLAAVLSEAGPDVVAIPGWADPAALHAQIWCLGAGVPVILIADSTASDAPRRPWREALKRIVVRGADAAFVAGSRQADYVVRLGMPRRAVTLGYDVVDNRHFASGADAARREPDAARRALGLPPAYALFVGRFVARKNVVGLLEGYARYRADAGPTPLPLVVVGDGPLRETIERRIADLGIGGTATLLPFAPYTELPALYGLARALIVPSLSEPWGLVVNEAMASGLPVFASTACGCAPDLVVDGLTGATFPPLETAAIAAAFAAADVAARMAAFGRAARDHVAAWDLDRHVDGLTAAGRIAIRERRGAAVPAPARTTLLRLLAAARSRAPPGFHGA